MNRTHRLKHIFQADSGSLKTADRAGNRTGLRIAMSHLGSAAAALTMIRFREVHQLEIDSKRPHNEERMPKFHGAKRRIVGNSSSLPLLDADVAQPFD